MDIDGRSQLNDHFLNSNKGNGKNKKKNKNKLKNHASHNNLIKTTSNQELNKSFNNSFLNNLVVKKNSKTFIDNNNNNNKRKISYSNNEILQSSSKKFKPNLKDGNKVVFNDIKNNHQIVQQRHSLPIYQARGRLLKFMKNNETVIVIADTGVGKTTQIPQYLHEDRQDANGGICVTQPRRVAAISVAKRLAEEMNTNVGGLVGFSVRFEDVTSKKTKLRIVTDGILLREAMVDPLLKNYNWVILDEAHERTVCTDVLFGVVKSAQAKRRQSKELHNLHIIVMSATMNTKHFKKYFNNAPVLYVEGREHPIEIFYANKEHEDYFLACMQTVIKIHRDADPEQDILVFMTGQEEIDSMVHKLRIIAKDEKFKALPKLKVYPLYAALPSEQQMEVFEKDKKGERKIIISTNIAETSITIPGIRYVVDCGKAKVRTYNPKNGFDLLKVQWITQAQATQRTGRAGRISSGYCYRVYSLKQHDNMKIDPIPEIQRSNLSSVILQVICMGVKNILKFDFIDKPHPESMKKASESLVSLGAIEIDNDKASLTDLGQKMAQFPILPCFSKIILSAEKFKCTHEVS